MSKKDRSKKRKEKKEKQQPVYRTKEERIAEIKPILSKLSELQLNPEYEPIKKLYVEIKRYIQEGERIELKIPFPEIGRKILGVLATNVREQVWVKLEKN
uniref:Uncharacterized protein n=1 Tax=viral metagenome TaxID=1070528 RepID=A0A6C0CQB7_9ZZZZ